MKLDENSFSRNSFISLPPSDDSLLTTADFLQRPFPRQLSNDRDVEFQSRGRNPSRSLAADPQPESCHDVRSSFYPVESCAHQCPDGESARGERTAALSSEPETDQKNNKKRRQT